MCFSVSIRDSGPVSRGTLVPDGEGLHVSAISFHDFGLVSRGTLMLDGEAASARSPSVLLVSARCREVRMCLTERVFNCFAISSLDVGPVSRGTLVPGGEVLLCFRNPIS